MHYVTVFEMIQANSLSGKPLVHQEQKGETNEQI